MKSILLIIFGALAICTHAMDINSYFEKINANYSNLKSFELTLNYKLFKGYSGVDLRDEYQSVLRMDGKNSHRKLYQDEIVTTPEHTLVLNHNLRTIQIMPPVEEGVFDLDVQSSIDQCQDIRVEKIAGGEQIQLILKKESTVDYARIDVEIDENYWVSKITLYYSNQMNFSQDYFNPEVALPRLVIEYQELKKKWKDKVGISSMSTYLIKNGETYAPAKNYEGYEIIQ